MLLLFVRRTFSSKPAEVWFLESRGFLGVGNDKNDFWEKSAVEKTFKSDIQIQH
jgi:hypothetical protein